MASSAAAKQPDYRLIAQSAVEYVRKKMTVGASNKVRDVVSSRGTSLLCLPAERGVEEEQASGRFDQYLRMVAAIAENTGCGNCGEQAAIAFVYLMDRGIRPLDFMPLASPGDHAFDIKDPGTWTALWSAIRGKARCMNRRGSRQCGGSCQ
jgi:hypothetical protein